MIVKYVLGRKSQTAVTWVIVKSSSDLKLEVVACRNLNVITTNICSENLKFTKEKQECKAEAKFGVGWGQQREGKRASIASLFRKRFHSGKSVKLDELQQ